MWLNSLLILYQLSLIQSINGNTNGVTTHNKYVTKRMICVLSNGQKDDYITGEKVCDACQITQYNIGSKTYQTQGCADDDDLDSLLSNIYEYGKSTYVGGTHKLQLTTPNGESIDCGSHMRKSEGNTILRFSIFIESEPSKTVEVTRKCCIEPRCNERLEHIDMTRIDDFRKWEREQLLKWRKADHELDAHYEVVEHIQGVVMVLLLLLACAWPFVYMNKTEKSQLDLISDLQSAFDYDMETQKRPEIEFSEQQTKEVSGQLTFYELCEVLCKMEEPRGEGESEGSGTHSGTDTHTNIKFKYRQFQHIATGNGHGPVKVIRQILPKYDHMLWRLFEHGPYQYNFKPIDLVDIFDQAKDIFAVEPTILNIFSKKMPIAIIGDIRGQYQDLHRWLQLLGCPPQKKLVFLGGVLDNNQQDSLECLALISLLKVRFPYDVFLLRGVGETIPFETYQDRYSRRNSDAISSAVTRLCSYLPLAAKINYRILAVHSGISEQMRHMRNFKELQRPINDFDMPPLAVQAIFNLPTTKVRMYRHGNKNRGEDYGCLAVERLCEDLHLNLIIRSRNIISEGIAYMMNGKLISLWSAPGYSSRTKCGYAIEHHEDVITLHSLTRQKND